MRRIALRTAIGILLVYVLLTLRTCHAWLGPHLDAHGVRRLPGTEFVNIINLERTDAAISVSPDDRWLVYSELTGSPEDLREMDYLDRYRIASIDLISGVQRKHRPESVPVAGTVPSFERIGLRDEASWMNGIFILVNRDAQGRNLGVDPTQDVMYGIEKRPMQMTCSDCVPYEVIAKSKWMHGFGDRISVPLSAGKLPETVYFPRNGVMRATGGGSIDVLVKKGPKGRLGMTTAFLQLRVSPDERFIAFCVSRSLIVPFLPGSGWIDYLYIKDLHSGREKLVAARHTVSNLIWSSDSSRLYFAGYGTNGPFGGGSKHRGVFVVDANEIF
jgi:WD40-like Beta Propeller Repeat